MKSIVFAAFLALLAPAAAQAEIAAPTGKVILSVTGAIENKNAGDAAQFDMQMLETLGGREAAMQTPWTEGNTEFKGPLLRNILKAAGAHGSKIHIIALNDYAAELPIEDAEKFDTILATQMNGKPMSVRDKGPLFLIYPFDTNPELYNEKYFSRSVWQIKAIEVIN